jgi:hypothetical protein
MDNEPSYEMTANMIAEFKENKVILMTAENQNNLPCTIPINIAMKLTQQGRTLIIDFDTERLPLTQVFETKDCHTKAVRTCIENLYLLSPAILAQTCEQSLRNIFEKLSQTFEHIIIYAPKASDIINKNRFFEHINLAIVLGSQNYNSVNKNLIEKISNQNCRILQPQEMLQAV